MADLKYFNALMSTVLGNDDQRKAAKEYLAEVDPEIWGFPRLKGPQESGVGRVVTGVIKITLKTQPKSNKCRWLTL